jgi:hypothetical protein
MNIAVLGTLAAKSASPETDDLQTVLADQVFDGYTTDLNDQVLKEVYGG